MREQEPQTFSEPEPHVPEEHESTHDDLKEKLIAALETPAGIEERRVLDDTSLPEVVEAADTLLQRKLGLEWRSAATRDLVRVAEQLEGSKRVYRQYKEMVASDPASAGKFYQDRAVLLAHGTSLASLSSILERGVVAPRSMSEVRYSPSEHSVEIGQTSIEDGSMCESCLVWNTEVVLLIDADRVDRKDIVPEHLHRADDPLHRHAAYKGHIPPNAVVGITYAPELVDSSQKSLLALATRDAIHSGRIRPTFSTRQAKLFTYPSLYTARRERALFPPVSDEEVLDKLYGGSASA